MWGGLGTEWVGGKGRRGLLRLRGGRIGDFVRIDITIPGFCTRMIYVGVTSTSQGRQLGES